MFGFWVVGFELGEKIISWISLVKGGGYVEYVVIVLVMIMKRFLGVLVVEVVLLFCLLMIVFWSVV